MSKILVTAGGTGGHVFPALAVAKVLRSQGHEIAWLGTVDRLEASVVPAAGFTFHGLQLAGIRGKGLLGWLKAPLQVVRSIRACSAVIDSFQPNLVLGFGGYTAGPAGVSAWLRKIPLVVHEQNAIPGLTNRLLARIATRTLLGFSAAKQYIAQAEVIGNPVRDDICALHADVENGRENSARVLVLGGSLGAQHLNETVPLAVHDWQGNSLSIRHQVGRGRVSEVRAAYANIASSSDVIVDEFIDDMAAAYRWADIVIARAGALTVAELSMAGKPAILVPYPHAVDDHQTANAKVLSEAGAAELLPQGRCTPQKVRELLSSMLGDFQRLRDMAQASRSVAIPGSTENIAAVCNELMIGRVSP